MAANGSGSTEASDPITALIRDQADFARRMLGPLAPPALDAVHDPAVAIQWADVAQRLQTLWLEHQSGHASRAKNSSDGGSGESAIGGGIDFAPLVDLIERWTRQMPFTDPARQRRLIESGFTAWRSVLGHFGMWPEGEGSDGASPPPGLPRSDPRFADPLWREQPFFALLHQGYLLIADELNAMAAEAEGLEPAQKERLRFTTRTIVEALSPANFPLTNPVAIERARETRGESLIRGFAHLLGDLDRGQLTQTPPGAFTVGKDIAATPGKVVHETPLYQIIHYTPTTDEVAQAPVVIFPAWINRFYILDLNAKKSFVRWAVEEGLSVFMVSWKSADETMAAIAWDDYIAAQIDAVDFVRDRLEAPAVHTVGYCVAGTTLAATLAVLARRGEADKIASATFLTAQVDFAEAGDLRHFIGAQSIEALEKLAHGGYVDGRYLAAAFNLLRGNDLIWNYVGKNYLLGEEYRPFDLLHWNGDVANLPAVWHRSYIRDLYRDNRLAQADAMNAGGVPIDLTRITTPCYIQAAREDHIAPPRSVWKLTHHLRAPWTFLLAGSGHIAGVVNPPAAGKYQYWVNDATVDTLDAFIAGASEHAGSWWPHWRDWLRRYDRASSVPAIGKRRPGGPEDTAIEDAPGRYVTMR